MEKAISYNPFLKVLQSFFIMMRGAIKKISGVNQVGLSQGIEYKENVQLLKFLAGWNLKNLSLVKTFIDLMKTFEKESTVLFK